MPPACRASGDLHRKAYLVAANFGRYSLLQLLALLAAVASGLALCVVLINPPLGSTGLGEARLPALIFVIALWFCRTGFRARVLTYALVGTCMGFAFFALWFDRTDILFGHFHGPPPWIIAACISAAFGLIGCLAWWACGVVDYVNSRDAQPPVEIPRPTGPIRWLRYVGMAVLTLLSGCITLLAASELPNACKPLELNYYVEKRLFNGPKSIRDWAQRISNTGLPRRGEMAGRMVNHFIQPGDVAAIPALVNLLDDSNPQVRRNAAEALLKVVRETRVADNPATNPFNTDPVLLAQLVRGLNNDNPFVRQQVAKTASTPKLIPPKSFESLPKDIVEDLNQAANQPEMEVRSLAITLLGQLGPVAADASLPPLLEALNSPDMSRQMMALQSIRQLGPAAAEAAPRLAQLLHTPANPDLRHFAAQALGAIGPAAKADAAPAFVAAWNNRMLTIEDAQQLYKIDPDLASNAGILRPPMK